MTKLLAIANLTPDSFSDGGRAMAAPLDTIRRLMDDGADGVDIGAESTRPGARPLDAAAEWERLKPVLADAVTLCHTRGVIVSLDTRHAQTARKALDCGVDWINDVGGFRDPAMIEAVCDSPCKLVVMHAASIPADPSEALPADADSIEYLANFFRHRLDELSQHGISSDRTLCDPGIGFGKSKPQSLELTGRMKELAEFTRLVGHSRKSFLTLFTDKPAAERDDLTLAFSAMLVQQKVEWLRVHNVARHRTLLAQMRGA